MSEKVKLTREQAEAIDKIIEFAHGDKEAIINGHNRDWAQDKFKSLNEMTVAKIAKALYIGYEVEETFEVGDWVVRTAEGNNPTMPGVFESGRVFQVKNTNKNGKYARCEKNGAHNIYSLRHATPEEIAEEKQRRWWAKHGRKVWELRRNDLVSDKDGCSYTINLIKKDYVEFVEFGMRKKVKEIKESFKVICFAEDRKDVDHA